MTDPGYDGVGNSGQGYSYIPPPTIDPSKLTTDAVNAATSQWRRDLFGAREVLEARLTAIEVATSLRQQTIHDMPDQIKQQVSHLAALHAEKFGSVYADIIAQRDSVAQQFRERDIRSEREARDNKVAVDAAFAAQKEAAAKQDESNAKAIDKSERATGETIKTMAEGQVAANRALTDKLDDIKERFSALELRLSGRLDVTSGAQQGAVEQRNERRVDAALSWQIGAAIVLAISVIVAVYLAAHH